MSYKDDCVKLGLLYKNDEYVEDVDIEDYLNLENKDLYKLKCFYNHDLLFCNGPIKKPYFRHKNSNDFNNCSMSKWHLEFQSKFNKDETEIEFNKINENQIKSRRADVSLINKNFIIEFQHSKIELQEVRNRTNDYNLHNKEILWVIDGNYKIDVIDIDSRLYLNFKGFSNWRYENFKDYDFIFIDIKDKIYVVFPKLVKNNMIDVKTPYNKNDFIHLLKTNIEEINKDIPYQSYLYIRQQGAGNGKTYGIIQSIDNNDDFLYYKSFIIVSKQHSAKSIIYNEFKEQYSNGLLTNLENVNFIENGKQYIITYHNKISNNDCKIVICTMDSLFYKLGNCNNTHTDKFKSNIQSIINDLKKDGVVYNSLNFKLNKNLCLIIDETQDLSDNYGKAIISIIKNNYIDAYIVGDKLQSISFDKNAFLYLIENNFTDLHINKIKYDDTNVCRRFTNKSLITFINEKIPFDNYQLPKITPYEIDNSNNNNLIIFNRDNINSLIDIIDNKEEKINNNVDDIINFYAEEVNINNRKPNDFLIITPFTTRNWFCEALERAIQLFWLTKNKGEKFKRYVIFHKSETGTSIDLDESLDKTRIVSIHTSKGDGRKVVFIIGLTENGLMKFTDGQKNIVYDSLIHVALTRQKEKLYIRLEDNNDDIYKLFSSDISNNNIIPKISQFIKLDIKKLNKPLYTEYKDYTIVNTNENKTIDMSHHNIRYACIYSHFIIYSDKYDNKKQIKAIFYEIINCKIKICDNWKEYNKCLWNNNKIRKVNIDSKIKQSKTIPIINLNDKYLNIILENIKNIKNKLEINNYFKLCPIERILFLYMKDICSIPFELNITITEIYAIIDNYYNIFNHKLNGHNRCLCKNHFNNNETDINYLTNFYQDMINISNSYKKFFSVFYDNLQILLDHKVVIMFDTDLYLYKRIQIIAYDNNNVFIIYLKPNLNELNYYEILNESIIETFLIQNSNDKEMRFANKKIKTLVFSLNLNDSFEIEWTENDLKKDIIMEVIKDYLYKDLKMKTNNLYAIYNYYEKHNILNDLKKDFNVKNEKLPSFINSFFDRIEEETEITKDKFNFILNKRIENLIRKIELI